MSAFAASVGGSLRLVHDDVEHGYEQLAERVDLLYRAGEWGQLWITLARCFLGLARLGEQSRAVEVLGALEGHTSLDVAPVVPSVRKASLEARDRIEDDLGAERFQALAAAGAARPLPELVDRTRRALLGETPAKD